jgi:hypothetical protein
MPANFLLGHCRAQRADYLHYALEVLLPVADYGRKTDLVVHDNEGHYYQNFFSCADWGCPGLYRPGVRQASRRLNAPGHQRFQADPASFLAAFAWAWVQPWLRDQLHEIWRGRR